MSPAEHTHSPAPEEVMAHLDGEPTTLSRDAMDAHLASCAICRGVADDLRGVSRATKAWNVDVAPATLRAPSATEATATEAAVTEAADYADHADGKQEGIHVLRERRGRRIVAGIPAWSRSRAAMVALGAAAAVLIVVAATTQTKPPLRLAVGPRYMPEQAKSAEPLGAETARGGVGGRAQGQAPIAGHAAAARRSVRPLMDKAEGPSVQGQISRGPLVIRTALLRIVVKVFDPVRADVERVVADAGGFIDTMTVDANSATARSLRGTLRVPSDRLADVLTRLREMGQVVEDTQGSEDVTDQIVDLDARLASARATEQRLTELLRNRTGRLSDVLDVERELARVRLDIERLDAQKTNTMRRVTYASIDVHIAEERKAGLDSGPLSLATRIRVAAADGIEAAIGSLVATLLFVLTAGPVLLLWGALAAVIYFTMRRAKTTRPRASE